MVKILSILSSQKSNLQNEPIAYDDEISQQRRNYIRSHYESWNNGLYQDIYEKEPRLEEYELNKLVKFLINLKNDDARIVIDSDIVEKNSFQLSLLDKSGGDEGVRKNIGEYREIYNSVATIFEYLKAYLTTFQNPTSTYKMLDASVTNLKDVDGKIDGIEKTLKNINEGKSNFSMENPNKLIKESAKSYKKMLKELEKIQKIESDVKTELEEFKKNNTIKRKIIRGVGKGLKFTTIFLSVVSNVSRIFAGDYSAVATLSMSMERFWEELAK